MSTNFPGSLDGYTVKATGDVIQASHIDNLQDAVVSLEKGGGVVEVIAYAASITPDAATGAIKQVGTLAGNITVNAPANAATGRQLRFIFAQDSTGGRTVTWNAAFSVTNWTINTAANSITEAFFTYNGTNWLLALNPASTLASSVAIPSAGATLTGGLLGGGLADWAGEVYSVNSPANPSGPADPTNTNDSVAAFNGTLNALPTTGALAYVPGGRYKLASGNVTVPTGTSDAVLGGAGWGARLDFTGGATVPVANNTTGFVLRDLRVSLSSGSGSGLRGTNIVRPRVLNVWFDGGFIHIFFNPGTRFLIEATKHTGMNGAAQTRPIDIQSGSSKGTVIGAVVESVVLPAVAASSSMLFISGSDHIDVVGGVLDGVDGSSQTSAQGLHFSGATWCTATSTVITGFVNGDGVLTDANASNIDLSAVNSSQNGSSGQSPNNGDGFDIFNSQHIRLSGCTGNGNGTAGTNKHFGAEIFTSWDISADNCEFSDNGANGVTVQGSPDISLDTVFARRNQSAGVLAGDFTWGSLPATILGAGRALNLKINGGDYSDNNQAAVDDTLHRAGIELGGRTEAYISGGIRATDTAVLASKKQTYGIELANTAFAVINNADLRGNKTAPVNDAPGYSRITQCQGINPRGPRTAPGIPASTVLFQSTFPEDNTVHITGGTVTAIGVGGLPTPSAPTLSPATTGGTLATATYGYKITALTALGETAASAEATAAVTGPTGSVGITIARIRGAIAYGIYGRTSGVSWGLLGYVAGGLVFSDDGSVSPGAAAPGSDNSGNAATGLTAGSFRIPWGGCIKLTYSVAPTWTWMAD